MYIYNCPLYYMTTMAHPLQTNHQSDSPSPTHILQCMHEWGHVQIEHGRSLLTQLHVHLWPDSSTLSDSSTLPDFNTHLGMYEELQVHVLYTHAYTQLLMHSIL